ncbi:uncharacterized protein LOC124262489 [Haliotis rubra]|uniref:uncharacterized protein LOC124262489 n=1 Tax=Haliotis rubra TaxID=36100 RepID=UPI001EE55C3A|nr:uncharacterized protein LOC124262489 [Haliotis rubra]
MHHYDHSTHSTSGGGDEECGKCCCYFFVLGINIASILLCIRKMSRYLRIALLWIYVATAVLTAGLLISINVLGTNKFQAAPTDMRKVEDHVNNAFCQSLTLNSSDPFEAYTFDKEPVVDLNRTEEFTTSYTMTIFSQNYEYWGFYLLPGSTLRLNTSYSKFTTLFVIQGESNLQTWLDGKGDCSGCYIYKHDLLSLDTYAMNSTEADNYFFVFFNDGPYGASSTANFFLRRTLYDVTKATSNCTFVPGKPSCRFDVSFNPEQSVVFHSSRRARHQSIDMWSSCKARAWMYVIVFALLPILVASALSFLFWKFCKEDRTGEKQALVSDQGLEDVLSDQKLEDVVSDQKLKTEELTKTFCVSNNTWEMVPSGKALISSDKTNF